MNQWIWIIYYDICTYSPYMILLLHSAGYVSSVKRKRKIRWREIFLTASYKRRGGKMCRIQRTPHRFFFLILQLLMIWMDDIIDLDNFFPNVLRFFALFIWQLCLHFKVNSERQIFKKLSMSLLFTLRIFARNLLICSQLIEVIGLKNLVSTN